MKTIHDTVLYSVGGDVCESVTDYVADSILNSVEVSVFYSVRNSFRIYLSDYIWTFTEEKPK